MSGSGSAPQLDEEHTENLRLLKLIREEPAWALARVKLAGELEALAASPGAGELDLTDDEMRALLDELGEWSHRTTLAESAVRKLRARLDRKDDER